MQTACITSLSIYYLVMYTQAMRGFYENTPFLFDLREGVMGVGLDLSPTSYRLKMRFFAHIPMLLIIRSIHTAFPCLQCISEFPIARSPSSASVTVLFITWGVFVNSNFIVHRLLKVFASRDDSCVLLFLCPCTREEWLHIFASCFTHGSHVLECNKQLIVWVLKM